MSSARTRAAATLGAHIHPHAHEAWGWRARTLGTAVTTASGPAWLRVAASPADQVIATFWTGNVDAERHLPASIPRLRLRAWHDWREHGWAYRAELYDHVCGSPMAASAALTDAPDPPQSWWTALRSALDIIAATPTQRITVQPQFLTWAIPHYLDQDIDVALRMGWTTAHGDLHYGNLCGPDLTILDWEGWGQAPVGYDAATLFARSLTVPAAAARIQTELAPILDTPAGRYAELVVITELLHASTTDGAYPELAEPLRRRAAAILRQ